MNERLRGAGQTSNEPGGGDEGTTQCSEELRKTRQGGWGSLGISVQGE